MFSRKPFEWVPCFPARVFISPTSITPTFESFSLQLSLRESLNGQSSRSLSLIISEASVLRFPVTDSGGGITVVTRGASQRKINFRSKGFWWPTDQNKENAVINIGLVRLSPPQWHPNSRYNKKNKLSSCLADLSREGCWVGGDWGESVKKRKILDKNLFSDSVEWSAKML